MIKLKQVVVVEGKYDKIKLSSFIDAPIVTTEGFAIFKDKEKMSMLRQMAEKNGLIILTDSDSAGAVIRNHLCSSIKNEYITNVFIPSVKGKEKRKQTASKEGLLGVEGVDRDAIIKAFKNAGVDVCKKESDAANDRALVTKTDLYNLGLLGSDCSKQKRKELLNRLSLPQVISSTQMLTAINALFSREEFFASFKEESDE